MRTLIGRKFHISYSGVLEVHGEVLRGLRHPGNGRVRGRAQDPDPATGVFEHGEHLQPCPGQGDRLEEVSRQQSLGLGAQEVRRGTRAALG
jgi:hypothetical protein